MLLHRYRRTVMSRPTDRTKHTFPKDLLGDIVELALKLVQELIDRRGELALGIGVLRWISMAIWR